MLTKIIGALMVTAATTSLGLMSARQLKRRVRSLRSLVGALDIMRSEICTRLTPMPELLELLAAQSGEPANIFFANCLIKQRSMRGRPFVELWLSALKSTQELELNENELEPLTELGSALGRYDTDRQGEAILAARKRLEAFLQKAESERDRESKTRTMLGIAAGVMITIILI
ncbi:MAG TPA: stage III sporulation protein AB [Clostridiales bacterium]|jgi:stage III sporulation protein AB|nr:stage III sporulation protein AB [Clostridiales bacterium]